MLFSVRKLPLVPFDLIMLPLYHSWYLSTMLKRPSYRACDFNEPLRIPILAKGIYSLSSKWIKRWQMLSQFPPQFPLISWCCRVVKVFICLSIISLPTYQATYLTSHTSSAESRNRQEESTEGTVWNPAYNSA